MYSRLLARAGWRFYRRHWLQTLLMLVGIGAGVGLVTGIEQARQVALRGFELSAEGVSGQTTHLVQRTDDRGLPDSLYLALRLTHRQRELYPVVEGYLAWAERPGSTLRVLGLDWLAQSPLRQDWLALPPGQPFPLPELLTTPAVILPQAVASRAGLAIGDSLTLGVGGRSTRVWLAATVADPKGQLGSLALTDIATAQTLLGRPGELTRLERIAASPSAPFDTAALARLLPPGVALQPVGVQSRQLTEMTAAFSHNLRALGLLAVVVAMFLLYNTLSFLLLQRTPDFARLRAMGVTPGQIVGQVLTEITVLGLAGSVLGVCLGLGLSRLLTALVVQSISSLYFTTEVAHVGIQWPAVALGLLLGVGTTLVSGLLPARAAAAVPPRLSLLRSDQESTLRHRLRGLTLGGLACLVLAAGCLFLPAGGLGGGYAGLLLVIAGVALLVPRWVIWGSRVLGWLLRPLPSTFVRLAVRSIPQSLSRNATAIAALAVAVAMTVGVSLMVASFRTTVIVWLQGSLEADIYANPPGLLARRNDQVMDPRLVAAARTLPGVVQVATYRDLFTTVRGTKVSLIAADIEGLSPTRYRFAQGDRQAAWAGLQAGGVLVSEPLANRHGLRLGDSLHLPTDRGPQPFAVAGVYYDYASDLGVVTLLRSTYNRFYTDSAVSALGLYLAPGADTTAVIRAFEAATVGVQALDIRTTRALLTTSIATFDQTFAITQGLRALTLIVAGIGLLGALLALALERRRELGILRTLGLLPRQLWALLITQTGLMGLLAGLLAVPLGVVLAWGLVFVINRRAFGWTLQFQVAPAILLGGVVLAIGAAVLAALLPAWRVGQISPAAAIRYEES